MKAALIALDYQGLPVSFNEEGWINATEIAAHYGKEVYEWLRLPDTQRYLEALCRRHGINRGNPGYWVKARRGKSGGTWLHPRLGVRFAQWLNVDFAVWCDEQIETLLIQQHPHFDWKRLRHEAASSFKVMNDILTAVRTEQGKPTAAHHYINEARLVNWALAGEFASGATRAWQTSRRCLCLPPWRKTAVFLFLLFNFPRSGILGRGYFRKSIRMTYESLTPVLTDVCPHCKRRLEVVQRVECDGHAFPVLWHCPEHGAVPPMRSAVCNDAAYATPDWSAA